MESDKPDLNSILENARTQLEMYGRTSQENLTEATKEILLTRSKNHDLEEASGQLFEQTKTSAVADLEKAGSGKSIQGSNVEAKQPINSEIEVEAEESSNKNFDSSTMTLGDQQSFQNQAELTSQTTYTNIHELTGPVKEEETLIVTGPTIEQLPTDSPSAPSQVSQNIAEASADTTQATLLEAPQESSTQDDLQKLQDNQVSFNPVGGPLKEKKRSRSFFKRLFSIKKATRNV